MKNRAAQESGTALIVAMLLMLVLTIMLLGFYFVTSGEQKVAASNRDNEVTYYGAVAGLEQMSNLMANYFAHTASPTPTQIITYTTTASNFQPLPGITSTTYTLYCMAPPTPSGAACPPLATTPLVLCSTVGNVLGSCNGSIGGNGALAGLEGIITPFQLTVVADGPNNTEVKLNRVVQEVAVPIFEFGIFSDSDLSFYAGKDFDFGGRVHTNGNLFLAEDSSHTLTLDDYVTAAKDVIRAQLSNGYVISSGGKYSYTVDVATTKNGCEGADPGCRALGLTEGSVTGGPGSAVNSNWQSLSKTTYNGYIQSGRTGAKVLNIAIALPGINSQPIAMIQRPPASPPAATAESPTSALGMARFYNQASLRILLSDTQADIMNLPGVDTSEYPYPLAEQGSTALTNMPYTIQRTTSIPSIYCPQNSNCYLPPADACHPPLAESVGSTDTDYMFAAGTTLLGGYIKIEMQLQTPITINGVTYTQPGTWKDVTEEILAQGISRDEASGTAMPAATVNASSTSGSLSTNTTYYYVVTATNAWGESAGTVKSVSTGSNKTVKVSWPAVTNATGYNVYRTTTSGTYTGTGNGVINLVVGTSQGTSWVSPYSPTATFTDSGAISPTSSASGPPAASCTDNSIVALEEAAPGATANFTSSSANLMNVLTPTNFVPINMYDAREGEVRDTFTSGPTTSSLNGIMNLVEIDVGHLQQWFAGNIGTSGQYAFNGPDALWNSGYLLYVSDRRMNCNDSTYDLEGNCTSGYGETGEFGNEDIINPSSTTGTPNGQLDTCTTGVTACPPEDLDGDGVLDASGAYPHPIANPSTSVTPTGTTPTGTWSAIMNSVATNNPAFVRITNTQAQKNSVVVFRRAFRLMNGTLGNLPPVVAAHPTTGTACSGGTAGGFTVASENPIYVAGDYNASTTNGFNDAFPLCHVPASVIGDAVTLLSNAWTLGAQSGTGDYNSFKYPTTSTNRLASNTYYRMAAMGGKTNSFPQPSWGNTDAGTDGGVHNFLRYDEDWENATLYYLGSMASFYLSRQATGIFKSLGTVYKVATRNYTFDTDFQNINKLPPGTPRFTDVNALSYYQSILPSQ